MIRRRVLIILLASPLLMCRTTFAKLPNPSDEKTLENQVQELIKKQLFLTASQELIDFIRWREGDAPEAARWLQEIDEREQGVLESHTASLINKCYAEGYEQFFNGDPQAAIGPWKKYLELTVREASEIEKGNEVKGFLIRLETRAREALREAQLQASVKSKRKKIEALIKKGRDSYGRGDARDAKKIFTEVCRLDPGNEEGRRYLQLVDQLSQPGFDPDKGREYYNEGLRAYRLGQWAEAKGLWETALRLDPSLTPARTSLKQLESVLERTK